MSISAGLFREKGFVASSMRDIARAMNMEAASLYNHIKSKQGILQALLMGIAHEFTKGMKDIQRRSANPIEKLEALIELHVELTVNRTDAISLIPSEWIHLEEPFLKEFLELRDQYEKDFLTILDQAVEQNFLKIGDTQVALYSILSTLRWLYSWYSRKKKDPVKLKSELKKILLYGLN